MKLVSMLLILTFLASCGGRTPEPITAIQMGDRRLACDDIEYELATIEGEMAKRVGKRSKTGKNVALGVTGWFFIVPLFFMDFKHAEKHEYAAYKQRHDHLARIADKKDCGAEIVVYPTVEELEAEIEDAKRREKDK